MSGKLGFVLPFSNFVENISHKIGYVGNRRRRLKRFLPLADSQPLVCVRHAWPAHANAGRTK
jgi:hypothetical protein